MTYFPISQNTRYKRSKGNLGEAEQLAYRAQHRTPHRSWLMLLVAIVVTVLASAPLTSCATELPSERAAKQIGENRLPLEPLQPLATASGQASDYSPLDLQASGTKRVVNLWATWCSPCRAELPVFDELAPLASAKHLEIVGVSTDKEAAKAAELIDELSLSFPQFHDPTSITHTAQRVTAMPTTLFINEFGEVVFTHSGELNREELVELISVNLNVHLDS